MTKEVTYLIIGYIAISLVMILFAIGRSEPSDEE